MRDVVGWEGLYKVTSCGKVWSCRSKQFLKPAGGTDYQMVLLQCKGKKEFDYVHRIVAKAYIPNPDNLPEVNHKDEVRNHNWVENLEWCTRNYNLQYSGIGGKKLRIPVYCVELDKTYASITEAAQAHGIHQANLSALLKHGANENHHLGGYHWRYAN